MVRPLAPPELKAWLDDSSREQPLLLDVRESWELDKCRMEGATHMPMREVPARLSELDPGRAIVCICHHGARSMQVAAFLQARRPGGPNAQVFNLTGGLDAWGRQVDPLMPAY